MDPVAKDYQKIPGEVWHNRRLLQKYLETYSVEILSNFD